MRFSAVYPLMLFVALTLTGCSATSGTFSPAAGRQTPSSAMAAADTTAPPAAEKGTLAPAVGFLAAGTGTMAPDSADPTIAAIQSVIQKANQEQQDAFTKNDPTIMKDTATSSYYNQLVQTNSDMANGGVSAIKLLGIDWGQVSLTNPTSATATTFETWQTTYGDGTSDQAREQNVYTLVQQQGTWLIQANGHPNSDSSQPGGSPATSPSRPTAPTSPSGPPATGQDTSHNWSGYAATSGTFTTVTGTWTVPNPQSSTGPATGATWVGIGGANTRDLIQAGTEETVTSSGNAQYDGWIEMLPQVSQPVQFAVHPGDSVTVSISQQGSGQWLIQMTNNTTTETYQTTVQYASSLSSAEWVEEAPVAGRRLAQIDNFGTIQFSRGTATENGKSVTIAGAGAKPITMIGPGGGVIVTTSVLTPDGQGFSVTESASAPAVGSRPGAGS